MTVRQVIATCVSGTTESFWSWQDKTMTIVNGNPTFSSFTYRDSGTVSTQLTGDNQIVINNFNVVKVTIPVASRAIANKGASMVKYRAVCGNISDEKNYSSSADVELSLGYIKDKTITVYAIDSRGNSKAVSITIDSFNWKNYIDPTISSASIARQNGVGTTTTLNFSGKIWKTQDTYDFGAVANEIVTCNYKYKKTSESEYGNPINITPIIDSNGNYNFNSTITGDIAASGFSLTDSFNIQITIEDKIRTITYNLLLGAGSPAMAIHKNGVSFGAPYNTSAGGALQIKGVNIENKSFISESTSNLSKSMSSGTWVTLKTYQETLTKGNYLAIFGGQFTSSSSGVVTLRYTINNTQGNACARSTIPINSNTCTSQVVDMFTISADGTYTFGLDGWANVAATGLATLLKIVKL